MAASGLVAALALVLVWLFGMVLPAQRKDELGEWRARLAVVADARQAAIERWVAERVGDARRAASYPSTRYLLSGSEDPPYPFPEEEGPAVHLREVLDLSGGGTDVVGAYVLTPAYELVVSSTAAPALEPSCLEAARAALGSSDSAILLHTHSDGSAAVTAASIVRSRDGDDAAVLGVAMVSADPTRWLYPLLSAERGLTDTGETLLVRLVDGEVADLSPRRREPQRALALERRPYRDGTAVAAAISGVEGVAEFSDDRGRRVLAATRRIAGTDWGLVVRVDEDEALAAFVAFRRSLATHVALGVLGLAALAWAWRRGDQARTLARLASHHAERAALLEQANDAVLFVGRDGHILEVNRRAEEMYRRSGAELTGMTVRDLRREDLRSDVPGRLEEAADRGIVFETVHVRGDGAELPVEVSSRLVHGPGGQVLLATVRDVSDRKAAERRIAELNRLLRTIFEVDQLIARESDVTALLEGACAILVEHGGFRLAWAGFEHDDGGIVPAAIRWSSPTPPTAEVLAADRRRMADGPSGTALREGRQIVVQDWLEEERFASTRTAAQLIGVRASWTGPLTGSTPRGMLAVASAEPGVFTDDVAALLDELAGNLGFALATTAAAARLAALVDAAPVAIYTLRLDGVVTFWNSAAERIFGFSAEEAVGRPLPILAGERHSEFGRLRDRVARGEWFAGVELERRRKDGSPVHISLSTAPLRGADGTVREILALAVDVTAQRRAEERLQHAQRMEAIGRLAGGIAHDFNNLLQVMQTQVDLLSSCGDEPLTATDAAAELADAVRRGASLTRQLLLFSRREATRPEILDLGGVVRDTVRLLRRVVREHTRLTVDAAEAALTVHADRGQLEQVILNLVVNAADAVPGGGEVTLRAQPGPDRTAVLEVEDTGPGIPPEIREAVLEPFFTTKKAGEGTGLGLSVVHGIVARHQGRLEITDGAHGGARVRVVLPVAPGVAAGASTPDDGRARHLAAAGGRRVLLVEDQEQARTAFTRLLRRMDAAVEAVGSVAEAEAAARANPPDLLLTDVGLPDGSGAELAARLVARQQGLRAILMSGYAPPEELPTDLAGGNIRFLQKPFSLEALTQLVRDVLA